MADFSELRQPAWLVAPRILGSELIREIDGQQLIGRIVETEAYTETDAASHSFHGRTPRTDIMFGREGTAYVYFTYGMHYCFNVVTGEEGHGDAVLIRALEPLAGINLMHEYRHNIVSDQNLTNGPAKLCQALLINKELNGHDLRQAPLRLVIKPALAPKAIVQTTRIGITRDQHRLWRFFIKDSPYVS
ncbi:MAG TPA: DNA-3-methyladenine glycosylase [Candidatus Binatia bacterium]|nr:DNA-3-methyladenine glycosylase [Candidatus Binatia bacterium]